MDFSKEPYKVTKVASCLVQRYVAVGWTWFCKKESLVKGELTGHNVYGTFYNNASHPVQHLVDIQCGCVELLDLLPVDGTVTAGIKEAIVFPFDVYTGE